MEARKITIILGNTNELKTVVTDATTLGELKDALTENGIQYEGMSFMEGLTRSELRDDASILPKDVEHKGKITNELVFMLTRQAKLKSGSLSRAEIFNKIKEQNLQDTIKESTGKNFTNCSNDVLMNFIFRAQFEPVEVTYQKVEEDDCCVNCVCEAESDAYRIEKLEFDTNKCIEAVSRLARELSLEDLISDDTATSVLRDLSKEFKTVTDNVESPYSEDDLEDMFDFID